MAVCSVESLARDLNCCAEDERLRLLSGIQRRGAYLTVLNSFAASVIGISSYEDLVWYVAEEVVAELGFVDCVIYRFEKKEEMLVQQAAMGEKSPGDRLLLNSLRIPLGIGITGRVAENGKPILIADLAQETNYVEDLSPALSEICVPLIFDGEILGVIDCEDPRPNHFHEEHLEILEAVASITSSKIKECEAVEKMTGQAHVLSLLREAVVVSNLEGFVTECNNGASDLLGYERRELIGSNILKLIQNSNSGWEENRPEWLVKLESDGQWRGPLNFKRPDGEKLIVDVSITPLRDKDGKYVASISVARDITQLVAVEHKLKEQNAALHHQQTKLEEALKDSRAAFLAKDEFMANTSHELRTPLAGVMGMIDLLGETELDNEQKELVSTAELSANTLSYIINDILDFAKLDAGKVSLREAKFDIVATIGAAIASLRPAAEEKGLRYLVNMPDTARRFVMADANRLVQIVFNLVGNAVKFTEKGEVETSLSLTEHGEFTDWKLTVKDTGIGFSEETAGQIFERFEQIDASSRKASQGTGLGLAISKELAEMMGGTISAESQPGAGALFQFTVRFKTTAQRDPSLEGSKNKAKTADDASAELQILVAEDNIVNRSLIGKLLNLYGWSSTIVEDGKQALDTLEQDHTFDLVLMDIRMPVMDGVEASKAIRQLPGASSQIPIIALTANALPADQQEYIAMGMNAVVPKPIDKALLKATILAHAT